MARPKSELLSAFGSSFEIFKAITDAVIAAGGSDEDLRRVLKNRNLRHEIAKLIVGQSAASGEFPVWKRIQLGLHKTPGEYRTALAEAGNRVDDYADQILGKTECANTVEDVDLVNISIAELGFEIGATRDEVYRRAAERGLDLCPAEVGPALRLAYADQPPGEWLLVAMEPIRAAGSLSIFSVGRDEVNRRLRADWGEPGRAWGSDLRWLFRRKSR